MCGPANTKLVDVAARVTETGTLEGRPVHPKKMIPYAARCSSSSARRPGLGPRAGVSIAEVYIVDLRSGC
jgi:hypothetical protein